MPRKFKMNEKQRAQQQARRSELIEISNMAKQAYELNASEFENYEGDGSVNSLVMHAFYPDGKYETAGNWRKQNKHIVKGSKGFAIWGKPRKFTKKADENTDQKDKEYKAFPVAYLFHESQVKDMEVKAEVIA